MCNSEIDLLVLTSWETSFQDSPTLPPPLSLRLLASPPEGRWPRWVSFGSSMALSRFNTTSVSTSLLEGVLEPHEERSAFFWPLPMSDSRTSLESGAGFRWFTTTVGAFSAVVRELPASPLSSESDDDKGDGCWPGEGALRSTGRGHVHGWLCVASSFLWVSSFAA